MAETNHDAVWVVDSEDVRNHVLHLGPGPDPPWQGHLVEVIFGHAQINLQLVFSSLLAGDQQRCGLWLPVLWQLTHPFNGPFLRTSQVSRYQKGKTNLHFTEARDSEWQWHQLGCMQVCTLLQTDNHASTPLLSFFYRLDALPAAQPTSSKHWNQLLWQLVVSVIVVCFCVCEQFCLPCLALVPSYQWPTVSSLTTSWLYSVFQHGCHWWWHSTLSAVSHMLCASRSAFSQALLTSGYGISVSGS